MTPPSRFSRTARAQRRLTRIRRRITELQAEIAVLDEQVVFQQQVEGDAQTDAVVAGHEVAAREHRAARSDLDRTTRQRDALRAEVAALRDEQDSLLEGLLD